MTNPFRDSGRTRRILAGFCGLAWLGAFVATHIPPEGMPRLRVSDWRLHAIGYFLLCGAFVVTLAAYGLPRGRRIVVALAGMLIYSVFDELTQALVRRTPSMRDLLADLLGAVLAVLVVEALLAWGRAPSSGAGPEDG